ncbi:hypothetical protein [Streptomyces yaizuensis]|uniref:Uncharacterized protein n=1 Tax=Streptomyces yaizuensis TaxID=2989713 RepID=A0ABQ5P3K3_9ACTN|nr:hypothetical protein [Streptomyces sp. YSPA8]GLF97173.1 hypothetical protein SYYSPA8_22770 [Streptomyces sp. YSPA8]
MSGHSGSDELSEQQLERLRLALGMIGDEAARKDLGSVFELTPVVPPAPVVSLDARRRSRRRGMFFGGGVVAAAAALVIGLVAYNGSGPGDGAGGQAKAAGDSSAAREDKGAAGSMSQSDAEGVACARLIAEGDIVSVRDAPEKGRILLTLDITKWIKPDGGKQRVELDLVDPAITEGRQDYGAGDNVLITVPTRRDLAPGIYAEGGKERKFFQDVIYGVLMQSKTTTCRPYWKNPPGPDAGEPGAETDPRH